MVHLTLRYFCMSIRIRTGLTALVISIIAPVTILAQSIQVFGGHQSARDCYMAATIAAQIHTASKDDADVCTFALEEVTMKPRDRVATLVNRGIIYVALEEYNKAIRDYDKAYQISPDIAEIHVNRGNMLFMSGHLERAVAEYTRAIELKLPRQYVVYYNRALAYEKLSEYDKAEADYRRALELMPGWVHAQDKLDRLLNRTKKG